MLLADLLEPGAAAAAKADRVEVGGLASDSRVVRPGDVFAALAGTKADGARFMADAVAKGAVAIVAAQGAEISGDPGVPVVRVADPRLTLARMAARFYHAQPETAVAVTGTSGKTSVAEFTRQIFAACGRQAASLGTIGVVKPGGAVYGSLTTPDPISLHRTLAALADDGVTHLAFEASSHGLDQRRLDGVRLTAAAFTNLGRDHMDYHATVDEYLAAKLRLFTELLEPGQPAVVNTDGDRARDVIAACEARGLAVATVGKAGRSIRLAGVAREGFKQRLTIGCVGRRHEVLLPLVGAYQVETPSSPPASPSRPARRRTTLLPRSQR